MIRMGITIKHHIRFVVHPDLLGYMDGGSVSWINDDDQAVHVQYIESIITHNSG